MPAGGKSDHEVTHAIDRTVQVAAARRVSKVGQNIRHVSHALTFTSAQGGKLSIVPEVS